MKIKRYLYLLVVMVVVATLLTLIPAAPAKAAPSGTLGWKAQLVKGWSGPEFAIYKNGEWAENIMAFKYSGDPDSTPYWMGSGQVSIYEGGWWYTHYDVSVAGYGDYGGWFNVTATKQ